MVISDDDRRRLLELARRALEARVRRQVAPELAAAGALALVRGAFVSIHRSGDLRGCLGRLEPDAPLAETIVDLATAVADSDPRFDPVTPQELMDLVVEVSILTPARRIVSPDEIQVGRHGLIVEQGRRRGVLLPQVATDHQWTSETFIEQTCRKAGLAPDAWMAGAQVYVFEAEVFGEVRA